MANSSTAGGYDYSAYRALGLHKDQGIMTITLSNPGRRNAVTSQQSEELTRIWDDVWLDPEVSVIVLTGANQDFCSGADLASLSERVSKSEPTQSQSRSPVNFVSRLAKKHLHGILDCEKPTIAKVRGVAYGVGVTIALACDLVYAAPGARFCDSHVKAGMVAGDGGVLIWPLLVGMHRAKEYLMTGEPVEAEVAERIGLINACVPDDSLDSHVLAVAERLRDLPPHAVNYTKVALNTAMKQMAGAAFEMSLGYEMYSMGMDDFREATTAFVEKRKGKFLGK
ncbi:MAG: enoyl-CoA hydratase-related protein [Gammaproteobacteria bacterium]|nr:enoyl-CoA hydratase-related protein [Gammaproteobacteria bacterium]MCY4344809.1 enoyl-CoA hydratase-related protein [Gammaproteobacteria bacterium]